MGDRALVAAPTEGPRIVIEDAWLDLHGHAVATFSVTQDDVPLALDQVDALQPRFTLATLTAHPEDGLRAWRSEILNGTVIPILRPSGAATPDAAVLTTVQQPGAESPSATALVDLGGGRYRYVLETVLTAVDPDETLRIGVWLERAPAPSLDTAATRDFRPLAPGGPVEERETVLDEDCAACHGLVVRHGARTRVRLCLTCHTWQHSDPDTIDPASLATTTAAGHPNPLELGRLLHRIHRGKRLPTLYVSSSQAVPAPALDAGSTFTLPFTPSNATSAVLLGKRFSVIGGAGKEVVFGKVVQKMDVRQVSTRVIVTGNTFPRDYRDCDVCHAGARQAYEVVNAISRRTCSGCHPDVWFDASPITDVTHIAHFGGPRTDDGACRGCHIENAGTTAKKVYAPIVEAHQPPLKHPRFNLPHLEILKVEDLVPGGRPKVTFRVWDDKVGPLVPSIKDPQPKFDPDPVYSSVAPRNLTSLTIRIAGPAFPDYGTGPRFDPISSSSGTTGPDPLSLTTNGATDEYVYAFTTTMPLEMSGTWAVGMEARRTGKFAFYANDTFAWPYTGETITESPDNVIAYVDTATGRWPPDGPGPRRKVVAAEKCFRCHLRIEFHGTRHDPNYCIFCHTPLKTDYSRRTRVGGFVDLGQTYDGIEERSLQFNTMIHRIHTGRRVGGASLEGLQPFWMNGNFREGLYPADLANCTLCHVGKTYLAENIPAGASPTVANETATVLHAKSNSTHTVVERENATPPIQTSCLGCHAAGPTFAHVAAYTSGGRETCGPCHEKGPVSTDVVHRLAPATVLPVAATFSSIVQRVFVPRCASSACHGVGAVAPRLDESGAYAALVGVQSFEASMRFVEPNEPERSYLVHKLRGTAASVGGTGAVMPPEGALAPADVAAIEAWIANGAPND